MKEKCRILQMEELEERLKFFRMRNWRKGRSLPIEKLKER
jgi:hypothetical protein